MEGNLSLRFKTIAHLILSIIALALVLIFMKENGAVFALMPVFAIGWDIKQLLRTAKTQTG